MMTQNDPQIVEKCYFLILDMSHNSRNRVPKRIQGSTTQPLEPPARLRPPAARISRILGIMETSISTISRIVENKNLRFPIFPGFWSANLIFSINFAIRFRLEINLIMTPQNYRDAEKLNVSNNLYVFA